MADRKLIWWRYTDLSLSVERNPEGPGYRIQALLPTGKEDKAVLPNPFEEGEIERLRAAAVGPGARGLDPRKIGRKLYDAIFSRHVAGLFAIAQDRLKRGQGLRLRFRAGSPEVSDWPFELLHDGKNFLALSRKTPIVRYLGRPNFGRSLRVSRPLRILVISSNPPGSEHLDMEGEWKGIHEALEPLVKEKRVEVERLDSPTLPKLAEKLAEKEFHVLHFIGHGIFDPDQAEGVLLFSGLRKALPVPGDKIAQLLKDPRSIRLVFLNACEGARSAPEDRFAGVAQSLIQQGIPAVIAMQAPILDSSSVLLAQRFYEAVAKGRPVDRALTEARKSLFFAGTKDDVDWVVPVLFMHSSNGKILPLHFSSWLWGAALAVFLLATIWVWSPWKPHCPSPKGVDMEFAWIPAGKFVMGSTEDDEQPPHEVTIAKPFCLGVYEVTQEQWESVKGPNSVRSDKRGPDLPLSKASYKEIQDFLHRLNEKEGRRVFRLPSEAEWEYAASVPGGDTEGCDRGSGAGPFPIGSFQPNSFGLYDMLGNVWELTRDWYGEYRPQPAIDPTGPATGEEKVRKGGSYDLVLENCRAAKRKPLKLTSEYQNTGFRVLRELR